MKKYLVLYGCIWCMLMSCSHEPTENETPDNNVHEWQDSVINGNATMSRMMFNVGDSITVVRQEGKTRATTTVAGVVTFENNDLVTIGVSGSLRGASEQTKNYKVTNTSTGALTYNGTATDAFKWITASESVALRAWSYGDGSTTSADPDNLVYNLETDQQTNGYKELLYSPSQTCTYAANSGGISVQMYHQLARVVFTITHDKSADLSINSISIGDGSTAVIPTSAKFHKPTSGNIGTWDNIGTQNGQITPKTESVSTTENKYSAVLIPRTYAKGTKFLMINTNDGDFAYIISDDAGVTLAAGNQYNFTIDIKDAVPVSGLTISDIAAVTYNGSAHTPLPVVKDGTRTLVKDTHYTLSYSNNINAGTATVTVTGIGAYSGTQNKNFTINKATGTITLSKTSLTANTSYSATLTATLSPYESGATVTATSGNTSYYTASAGAPNGSGVSTVTISGVAVCSATNCTISATSNNYTYSNKTARVHVTPKANMIDVIFNSDGSITDNAGTLTWTKYGSPSASYNNTYQRYEVAINNTSSTSLSKGYYSSVYNDDFKTRIANGFSQEVFFKSPDVTSRQTIMGTLENGGHAILIKNGKIEIGNSIGGGGTIYSSATLQANTYYHVFLVWHQPSGFIKLYINGVLDTNDTSSRTGSYGFPVNLRYTIGADLASSGTPPLETNAKCFMGTISIARVYASPLSDADASALYNAATSP